MKNLTSAALVAAALAAGSLVAVPAFAQTTRAEVKAEAASTAKSGTAIKEASPEPKPASDKMRPAKSERRPAKLNAAEQTVGDVGAEQMPKSGGKTRQEVKTERDTSTKANAPASQAESYKK